MAIPARVTIDDATRQEQEFIVQQQLEKKVEDLNEAADEIYENYMDNEFAEAGDKTAQFGVSAQD